MPEFISIQKAAKMLGVSVQAVRYWANKGKIKCFTTPTKHRMFSIEDIETLIKNNWK